MKKFITLVEQVIFLLGQASLSVSYNRRRNILKMITEDSGKAKAMLKENEYILRESKTHLFGNKFWSHMIGIENSMKKSLEAFKDVGEKKSPFRKGPSYSQNKPHGAGLYYYARKPGNWDQHNKYGRFQSSFQNNSGTKFHYKSWATQGKYLCRKSKGGSSYKQLKTDANSINDFNTSGSNKIIFRKIPNVSLAGRLSQYIKQWKKITRDHKNLPIVKGYQIPFTNLAFQEKLQNSIKLSEQQSLLVDQEISELLGKGAIQKSETAQEEFLSNLFLVREKDGRNHPMINLKKLNTFIPYEHLKIARFALSEISSETKQLP